MFIYLKYDVKKAKVRNELSFPYMLHQKTKKRKKIMSIYIHVIAVDVQQIKRENNLLKNRYMQF